MRITSGMISSQYSRNLNKSLGDLNFYSNRAVNFRKFDNAGQDPVSAAKAYGLRTAYAANNTFKENAEDIENHMLTAQASMMRINSIIQEAGGGDIIQAINGTMAPEDRAAIAAKLKKMQESILASGNTKYGDKYVFGGNTFYETPFSVDADGNMLYKGVNVNTGLHNGAPGKSSTTNLNGAQINFGEENGSAFNGYTLNFKEPADPPVNNSIDNASKVINIYLDPPATKQDAQDALQALGTADDITPAPPVTVPPTVYPTPLAGVDFDKITIQGTATDPVIMGTTEISGGVNAIPKGFPEVIAAGGKVTVGGAEIDFGVGNTNMFNGYELNIITQTTPPGTNEIDPTGKKINIYLPDPSTKADLQTALQGLTAPPPPAPPATDPFDGVDFSQITIGGTLAEAVTLDEKGTILGGAVGSPAGQDYNLDGMSKEKMYLDLGLGLSLNPDGTVNEQSVFDSSIPGISFLGFGVDENGTPNNLHTLLGKIADGLTAEPYDYENTLKPLIANFSKQQSGLLTKLTESGARSNFISYAKERTTDAELNLMEKMKNTEMIDPAKAIMDMKMQEHYYLAALQIGAKIIQPTFLDFMR